MKLHYGKKIENNNKKCIQFSFKPSCTKKMVFYKFLLQLYHENQLQLRECCIIMVQLHTNFDNFIEYCNPGMGNVFVLSDLSETHKKAHPENLGQRVYHIENYSPQRKGENKKIIESKIAERHTFLSYFFLNRAYIQSIY